MSVKKEASGRRSVQVEVEVPGTPEEVWQAIATGPGISSWFVPTAFEERDGKPVAVTLNVMRVPSVTVNACGWAAITGARSSTPLTMTLVPLSRM